MKLAFSWFSINTLLLSSFLFVLSSPVRAEPIKFDGDRHGLTARGFSKTLSDEFKVIDQVKLNAAVNRWYFGRNYCSLVFISNDGYALTAKHCLTSTLRKKKLIHRENSNGITREFIEDSAIGTTVTGSFSERFSENVDVNLFFRRLLYLDKFEIIALGRSLQVEKGDVDDDLLSDYALIKFSIRNVPCVSIGTEITPDVFQLSYPVEAYVHREPLFSRGQIMTLENPTMAKDLEAINPISRYFLNIQVQNYLSFQQRTMEKVIFHSAQTEPGSSGGGLFNRHGELIGIHIVVPPFSLGDQKKSAPTGGNGALSITQIHRELEKTLSSEIINQAFNCQPR